MGKVFNFEGDIILGAGDEINCCNRSCESCSNFMHFNLRGIFSPSEIRELSDRIKNIED